MSRTFLDIRTVHVLSGDGQTSDLRNVRCPAHARSVTLERCLACAQSGGITRDPLSGVAYAACRRPNAEAAASVPVRVGDVMSGDVLAVRPDVSVDALTEILLDRGIGGVPVVDAGGRPLGVVSKTDLVEERFVAGDTAERTSAGAQAAGGRYRVEVGRGIHVEEEPTACAGDVMSGGAATVRDDAPLAEAAGLMSTRGIHRVLVLGEEGRLAGVLTASDVVRWVAERQSPVIRHPPSVER